METMILSKILRIGDSHGIIIPVQVLRAYHLERGDYVVFGFGDKEQIFFKKLSAEELKLLKPDVIL